MTTSKTIRASDATSWIHCQRRAWLDHNLPAGHETAEPNEFDQLIMTLGMRHEWSIRRQLEQDYQVVEAVSEEHTRELMESGVQIIYQPKLRMDDVIGVPDFLIRQESGEYIPADAKLARSEEKKEIQIQLGIYRKLLGTSAKALVFLGTGATTEIGDESIPEVEIFISDMRAMLTQTTPPAVRYSESRCRGCSYNGNCKPDFEAKGELTLLYGVDSRSAPGLENQGIDTIKKLAAMDPAEITDVAFMKGFEKKQRAVLQAQAYLNGTMHQLKPIVLPGGTWIHFDIEANPLSESGNDHVYLWGFLKPPYDGSDFDYVWTDSERDDRQGWMDFLAKIEEFKAQWPDMVLAHFSGYEVQKIAA